MAPERTPEELAAAVEKQLIVLDTLEKRKKELEEVVIPKMVREANKPIYAAKEQAEKIIAEVNAEAKKIQEEANKRVVEAKEKVSILEQEADAFLLAAKKKDAESAEIKKTTEKDREDFGAEKYAHETNLATKKNEAEALMGNVLTLQTEQNTRKANLDGRESVVIKKEQDYQSDLAMLEKKLNESTDKIAELRAVEQAHADAKIEISTLKSENEDILASIKKENADARLKTEKNKEAYASLLAKEKEIDEKLKTTAAHLNSIAREQANLNDKTKTLHERERLHKILERQIDQKISVLKKLRAEDAGRSATG